MNHPTPHATPDGPDLVLLALLGLWLAAEAAAVLIAFALALLLTLAGWRPSQTAAAVVQPSAPCAEPAPLPLPVVITPAPAAPLERLTVAQLRAQARAAGLPRQLAHRGRRADLLAALAA